MRSTALCPFLPHCSATTSHALTGCFGDVKMAAPARWSRLSARQPLERCFLVKCANTFVQLGRRAYLQQNARMIPGSKQAMTAVSDSARPAAGRSLCVRSTSQHHGTAMNVPNACCSVDNFTDLAAATLDTNTCSKSCVSNDNYPSWCQETTDQCVCPNLSLEASYLEAGKRDYGCVTDCKYGRTEGRRHILQLKCTHACS